MNTHFQAGAVGIFLQASLLVLAVAVYWSGTLSQQTPLLFFLCLIVSSSNYNTMHINIILFNYAYKYYSLHLFSSFYMDDRSSNLYLSWKAS